jgi:APA family basic amino acid/polyamine antiporter
VPVPLVPLVISPRALVALGTLALLTLIHARGLGPGRRVQDALAAAKVAALVVFVAAGFAIGHGSAARLASAPGPVTASGMVGAFIPVMFTYSGWNAASYVAEEVRAPGRNVPLALGLGTLVVVALYLAFNALNIFALPIVELAAVPGDHLVDTVAERLFGFAAAHVVAAFTIVGIAASVSAMVLAGPRVYFAMARDGVFPRAAARVHPRFRAPVIAIVAQSAWSGVLVMSGSLAKLVSYTGFTLVLFNLLAVAGVFVLRRRLPDTERPFRTWGYPWAPALFVGGSAVMLVNELWRSRGTALAGLAVIAAGLPVYWLHRRRAAGRGGDRCGRAPRVIC